MAETTNAERITQLESIVNELTARVAADPANTDLPPLLAAAKAELDDLQKAAPAASAAPAAPAAVTVASAAAAPAVAPAPVARPKIAAPAGKAPTAAKASEAKAPAPAAKAPAKAALRVPLMQTRPNPAPPRPLPAGVPTRNANKR